MRHILLAGLLLFCTATGADALDTYIYGFHETGLYGNFGPTGLVGADGVSRVVLYSFDPVTRTFVGYMYRVTVPDGFDPETHPENPLAPGPVAPRTLVQELSFELGVTGYYRNEFYVPGRGETIYLGPAYGIRKYVFDREAGTYVYRGIVAPSAPWHEGRPSGTLAYDKRANVWYAGAFSFNYIPGVTKRRIWKYDGNQGPDGKWEVAFDYVTRQQVYSYHDGLEMVNGRLYLGDNAGSIIYEYTPEGVYLGTYLRETQSARGEGMDFLGLGFRALQHFWYGSNGGFITEFGGGLQETNNPPVAVAGAPLAVTAEQLATTVVDGSVSDPDGGELLCRWLQGDKVLLDWHEVAPDGGCPLQLSELPPFAIGSYPLTVEGMDDHGAADRDETSLTVAGPAAKPAMLKVETTPDSGTFVQGGQASYSIVVSNPAETGSQPAENVQLVDQLPTYGGLSWSSVTMTQGGCTLIGNNLDCSLGSIAAGQSVTVVVSTLAVTPEEACQAQPNLHAVATADGGLTAEDGGSLNCTAPPKPVPALSLEKSASTSMAAPGQEVTYSYTVRNVGNVPLAGVTVTDDNGTPENRADDFTVGTVATLGSGESATLTAATVPSNSSITARLASAGPSFFSVLSLGGDPQTDDSGIYCEAATVKGNVGIVGAGYFRNASNCIESGDFYKGTAVVYQDLGGQLKGETIADDPLMYRIRGQVLETAAYFATLPPTPFVQRQFPADGKVDSKITITGAPGLNVVRLPAFSLSKGYITLTGPPGTQFLLNISGTFNMNTGSVMTTGGVGPFDVIYNITNPKASVGVGRAFEHFAGILFAPYNEIHAVYGRFWDGQIIGGYNRGPIKLNYDVVVTTPNPPAPAVTNIATAHGTYGSTTVSATASATVRIH